MARSQLTLRTLARIHRSVTAPLDSTIPHRELSLGTFSPHPATFGICDGEVFQDELTTLTDQSGACGVQDFTLFIHARRHVAVDENLPVTDDQRVGLFSHSFVLDLLDFRLATFCLVEVERFTAQVDHEGRLLLH